MNKKKKWNSMILCVRWTAVVDRMRNNRDVWISEIQDTMCRKVSNFFYRRCNICKARRRRLENIFYANKFESRRWAWAQKKCSNLEQSSSEYKCSSLKMLRKFNSRTLTTCMRFLWVFGKLRFITSINIKLYYTSDNCGISFFSFSIVTLVFPILRR